MQQIQSFIMSAAQGACSIYEQRIILKVIEYAQPVLQGLYMKQHLEQLAHNYDNVQVKLPVRAILADGSHNYKMVLDACLSLMQKVFKVWNEDSGVFFATPLIYNVSAVRNEGVVSFYVARRVWDLILDFRRGYSQYDLNTALTLPTTAAVRFYILFASASSPVTYSVDTLKKMFGVEEKYNRTNDFIKRIVAPAQEALDKACVSSFAFEVVKKGNKITSLRFTPRKRRQRTSEELAAMLGVSSLVEDSVKVFLINAFSFSVKELGAHKVMLEQFCKLPYKFDILYSLRDRVIRGKKQKGYVIAALRDEVRRYKEKLQEQKQLRQIARNVADTERA